MFCAIWASAPQRRYSMTGKIKNLLRQLIAVGLAGVGIFSLAVILVSALQSNGDWFTLGLLAVMAFLLVLIPCGMGYLVYQRRYHELCSVLAMLASIAMFFILSSLPRRFGWYSGLDWLDQTTALGFLGIWMSLLLLFGPFFAAAWFYGMCIRLTDRYLRASRPRQWPTVNAATEE